MPSSKTVFKAVTSVLCAVSLATIASLASAEGLRPEVGRPLQQAQEALKAKRYADAENKVREAENVPNKTAAEQVVIERMRASIAASAGDLPTEIAVVNTGKLPAAEQLRMVESIAGAYYNQRDYANAATWTQRYFKDGGNDPQMRTVLLQAYYLSGDCNSVARSLQGELADPSHAPAEDKLQMLASCYQRGKDNTGYVSALEKLVTYYPKRDYWVDLLSRVESRQGFSDRLSLDVYRLKLAAGLMTTPSDYMEMAQMSLGDDYTAEAKKVVDQGFASKVLGQGADVERQKRLADLAARRYAEGRADLAKQEAEANASHEGNDLVRLGYNYVGYGQAAKGIALMEAGIKKGGLRRPDDAKLHLGLAYLQAGQKAKAAQVLKTVGGTDGAADLARLWLLQANRTA
jgi:outer membrane protein assembly factor BamD (BamD/ComL family)